MIEFYHNYQSIILPLHVFSTLIWLGAMIGYLFSTYPSIKQIPNEKLLVRTSLRTLRRLLNMIFILSIVAVSTGVIMALGESYSDRDPLLATIVSTKEALWVFMFFNTIFSFYKVLQAKKHCLASEAATAHDNVRLISHYLIVINIFLGIIAAYFGMMLSN